MFKVPLAELKEKIVASGKMSATDLEDKIKFKINELSGLISEEGAAHIIANELGVEVVPKGGTDLKVKEVYAGMRNVSVVGKVVRKFDVRTFVRNEKEGKVCSLVLGDETGTVRVVFWNEQVDLLDEVNEGTVIAVKESYVRENGNNREIHLGQRGSIEVDPEGVSVGEVRQGTSYERKKIGDLQGGEDGVELLATVVQVFDPRFFYVHPETRKRVQEGENGVLSYVFNLVLDDNSGTMRAVFWKEQVNKLLETNEEKMSVYKENMAEFEDVKTNLLGEQFVLFGKVVRNDMFDRLEFRVQMVEKADPEKELKRLEGES